MRDTFDAQGQKATWNLGSGMGMGIPSVKCEYNTRLSTQFVSLKVRTSVCMSVFYEYLLQRRKGGVNANLRTFLIEIISGGFRNEKI
jgi:hypothetical protein